MNHYTLSEKERTGITLFYLNGKPGLQSIKLKGAELTIIPLTEQAEYYIYKISKEGTFITSFYIGKNSVAIPLSNNIYKILNSTRSNKFIPIVLFPITPETKPHMKEVFEEINWKLQEGNNRKALKLLHESIKKN